MRKRSEIEQYKKWGGVAKIVLEGRVANIFGGGVAKYFLGWGGKYFGAG